MARDAKLSWGSYLLNQMPSNTAPKEDMMWHHLKWRYMMRYDVTWRDMIEHSIYCHGMTTRNDMTRYDTICLNVTWCDMTSDMNWFQKTLVDTPNAGSRTDSSKMTYCLAELFLGKSPRVALPWGSSNIHVIWVNYDNLTQSHCKGCSVRESFCSANFCLIDSLHFLGQILDAAGGTCQSWYGCKAFSKIVRHPAWSCPWKLGWLLVFTVWQEWDMI